MMQIISAHQLKKAFGNQTAVDGVSFSVTQGEVFGVLGPNGAGKTTTLRMLLGLYLPDAGTISLFGQPQHGTLSTDISNRIGYMPEERGLYRDESVQAVIEYLGRLKGLSQADARSRTNQYLEMLELEPHKKKKIKDLSKGMQQKAQLIATILHQPELLIVDEPFSGLDPVNTQLVQNMFAEIRKNGATIVMCSHEMHRVEAMCNRIALFNKGEIVLYGALKDIQKQFREEVGLPQRLRIQFSEKHAEKWQQLSSQFSRPDENGILSVTPPSGNAEHWQIEISRAHRAEDVLKTLLDAGLMPSTFQVENPTLDDIFVHVVQAKTQT
jgi:ABC-2 type transport system ATP-binding protein